MSPRSYLCSHGSKISCQRQLGAECARGLMPPWPYAACGTQPFCCRSRSAVCCHWLRVRGSIRQTRTMVEECSSWIREGLDMEVDRGTRWDQHRQLRAVSPGCLRSEFLNLLKKGSPLVMSICHVRTNGQDLGSAEQFLMWFFRVE